MTGHPPEVEVALATLDGVDPVAAARLRVALADQAADSVSRSSSEYSSSGDELLDEPVDYMGPAAVAAPVDEQAARRARKKAKRDARNADADRADTATWDGFWAAIQREEADALGEGATETIRGVTVPVPHDLPLAFDQRLERVRTSENLADVHRLVADLFGPGALAAWVEAGMTDREFRTVLLWGIGRGKGRDITFRQAYEAVRTQGKSLLPNRSARRDSAPSGGPSKRTSGASTGSHRNRSRR